MHKISDWLLYFEVLTRQLTFIKKKKEKREIFKRKKLLLKLLIKIQSNCLDECVVRKSYGIIKAEREKKSASCMLWLWPSKVLCLTFFLCESRP